MRKLIRDSKNTKLKPNSPRSRRSRRHLSSYLNAKPGWRFKPTRDYTAVASLTTENSQEVSMPSPWNELAYTNEFVGNLHGRIEPVPARVNTMVRVTTDDLSNEIQKYDHSNAPPKYIIGCGGALPIQPTLQAMGRHYFKW
jgi:hypothetical protein